MAKRRRMFTDKTIKKRKKEGRCQCDGKDYIPWIKVQDIASTGVSLKTFSHETQRQHHLLSRLESNFFYIVDWSEKIKDIKEQYVLDLDETIAIAQELSIKHPKDPVSKILSPMTTDFLLLENNNGNERLKARTIKYVKDLNKKRVLEKFDIEKTYWQRRNVDWAIVTEEDINLDLVHNIIWVRKAKSLMGISGLTIEDLIKIEPEIRVAILNGDSNISTLSCILNSKLALQPGTILYIIRFLIANRIWEINMFERINPESIICIQKVNLEKLYNMR